MTDNQGGVLYASGGHANLRLVSDEKDDWLWYSLGVLLTPEPVCLGRLATKDEAVAATSPWRGTRP